MNKQKGFSAVIVLLSLLLLVAVCFTGYFVWNTQNNKKGSTAEVAPATATKQEAKKETPTPAKEEQKYLVIKEWGLKMPLSSEIQDLTYVYNPYTKYEQGGMVIFRSQKLVDTGCSEDGVNGGLIRSSQESTELGTFVANIANNYYYYRHAQSACMNSSGPEDPMLKLQILTNNAISSSVKNLNQN